MSDFDSQGSLLEASLLEDSIPPDSLNTVQDRYQFIQESSDNQVELLDIVSLVTPPLFVHSIEGHRGHEEARLG